MVHNSCNDHWNVLVFILVIYCQHGKISHSISGLIFFWNLYLQIICLSFPENRLPLWIEFLEIWCFASGCGYIYEQHESGLSSHGGLEFESKKCSFTNLISSTKLSEIWCFKVILKYPEICSNLERKLLSQKVFLLLSDFFFHNCSVGLHCIQMKKRQVWASSARVPPRSSLVNKKMPDPSLSRVNFRPTVLELNQRRKLYNLSLSF